MPSHTYFNTYFIGNKGFNKIQSCVLVLFVCCLHISQGHYLPILHQCLETLIGMLTDKINAQNKPYKEKGDIVTLRVKEIEETFPKIIQRPLHATDLLQALDFQISP